jgi:hypothetical protein
MPSGKAIIRIPLCAAAAGQRPRMACRRVDGREKSG